MLAEGSLIRIVNTPLDQKSLMGQVGFILTSGSENSDPEVGVLDETGLVDVFFIPEQYLDEESSPAAIQYYNNYKKTVNEIAKEADDRQHKYVSVTNALARKFNITPDEVIGICNAMINYEEFFEDHKLGKNNIISSTRFRRRQERKYDT